MTVLEQSTWIDRVISRILCSPDDVVYVSGSISEGFGNSGSDLDVFLVTSDEKTISQWASLGGLASALVGYGSSYIDYERRQWDEMLDLGQRLSALDPSDYESVWRLPYAQLDLYYRASIGEAKHNPERFQALVKQFRAPVIRPLLSTWCGLRYALHRHACEAAIARDDWHAACFAAHAALQSALDAFLAREGEAYTGLKWRFEKLERRFGRQSRLYRTAWSLKARGELSPEQYVRDTLAFIDSLGLEAFLSWSLDRLNPKRREDCAVFELAGRRYLFQNKTKAFAIGERAACVWELLDGDHSRTQIALALEARFGVGSSPAAEEVERSLQAFRAIGLLSEG